MMQSAFFKTCRPSVIVIKSVWAVQAKYRLSSENSRFFTLLGVELPFALANSGGGPRPKSIELYENSCDAAHVPDFLIVRSLFLVELVYTLSEKIISVLFGAMYAF